MLPPAFAMSSVSVKLHHGMTNNNLVTDQSQGLTCAGRRSSSDNGLFRFTGFLLCSFLRQMQLANKGHARNPHMSHGSRSLYSTDSKSEFNVRSIVV